MTAKVIQFPRQRPQESWENVKAWADLQGWGAYLLAIEMRRVATPEERRLLPPSACELSWYWDRWLKGTDHPKANMSDPEIRDLYHLLIARMMGTGLQPVYTDTIPRQQNTGR